MFELNEIKEIRKKYKLNENGEIELTGRESAEDVSKMTAEKNLILNLLYFFIEYLLQKALIFPK